MSLSPRQLELLRALKKFALLNFLHLDALKLTTDRRITSSLERRGFIYRTEVNLGARGTAWAFLLTARGESVLAEYDARAEAPRA